MTIINEQQARKLVNQNCMADLDVKFMLHRSLSSPDSVISDLYLTYETETDILECLKDNIVTAVKRITIRRDNKEVPQNTSSEPSIAPHSLYS